MSNIRYCCKDCDFFTDKLNHFQRHKKTKKHKQKTMKYICEVCNYYTDLKNNLLKHIETNKQSCYPKASCKHKSNNQRERMKERMKFEK